jgi:hypothetical protein
MHFSNGKYASIAAKGDFLVYRPTFSHFNDHAPMIGFTWNGATLQGNMWWDVRVESTNAGMVGVTQLLNARGWIDTLDQYYLDGDTIIYESFPPYDPNNAASHTVDLRDNPGATIYVGCLALIIDFKDYLRYKPEGSDSIWVTLGQNTWNCDGNACYITGPSYTNLPPATPVIDSDEEPVWRGVRHGHL